MASSVNPVTSQPTTPTSNTSTSNSLNSPPSESMFLNLLVAQIQNQDPLNPTDSTQFVSQLAQFSELEQVMAIRNDTDTLVTDASTAVSSAASNTTGQTPTANQTQTQTQTQEAQ